MPKPPPFDWQSLQALCERAYGHPERAEKEPDARTLKAARTEVKAQLTELASRLSDSVTCDSKGDVYLRVKARYDAKRSLSFCIGGEGTAWVELDDGDLVHCEHFEEADWAAILEPTKPAAKAAPAKKSRTKTKTRTTRAKQRKRS